jgi:hypothetical protein
MSDLATANAYAIVTLVLQQGAWNTTLGNTKHLQVIRQKEFFEKNGMDNLCYCCEFIYRLGAFGTHQRRNSLNLIQY